MFIFPGLCFTVFVASTIPRDVKFRDLTEGEDVCVEEQSVVEVDLLKLVMAAVQSEHATRAQKWMMFCGVVLALIGVVVFVGGLAVACIKE